MSELQVITTNYTTTSKDTLELFELPQNYSVLINKLERLALGLDSALGNISLDRKEIEVAVSGSNEFLDPFTGPAASGHPQAPRNAYNHHETEIPLVVSDIWIGVILTLLIVSVLFFICSCFLYHKFQQWKNSCKYERNSLLLSLNILPSCFHALSLNKQLILDSIYILLEVLKTLFSNKRLKLNGCSAIS